MAKDSPLPNTAAIIVAGGTSRRMGFDKLTARLAGQPLISHSLQAFEACESIREITLVCDPIRQDEFRGIAEQYKITKLAKFVAGGKERQNSVWNGMQAVTQDVEYLAIHDAARPLIMPILISCCIKTACRYGAAAAAEPLADTIHRANQDKILIEALSREGIWRMQTPQVYRRTDLYESYAQIMQKNLSVTDEVTVFLQTGKPVAVEESEDWNFKITIPKDLALAEIILEGRKKGQL